MNPKQRFVILAQSILTSFDPRCDKEIVNLDCILASPDALIPESASLRHRARWFVEECVSFAQKGFHKPSHNETHSGLETIRWLRTWWEQHGA